MVPPAHTASWISAAASALLLVAPAAATPAEPVAAPHDAVACEACHPDAARQPSEVTCTAAGCHAQQAAAFDTEHRRKHWPEARAACASCHAGHALRAGAAARLSACEAGVDASCLECHPVGRYGAAVEEVNALAGSVHAGSRDDGHCASDALTCFDCHGHHGVKGAESVDAPTVRANVAETCGRCHAAARDAFLLSVHAASLADGSDSAPTCVSCHGAHRVLSSATQGARTSTGQVVFTCAECHEDPAVTRGSGLSEHVVESYERTFHGRAHDMGVTDTATCASCHRAHDVLSSTDPASPTHSSNLQATCTSCHPQVDDEMVAAGVHPSDWPGLLGALKRLTLYFPVAQTALNPLLVSGLGALVGFLSGLFGVGGGFLMTPLLIFIGIPAAVAAATDAAQITAGASSGALSHSRLGNVDFKMGLTIVAGGWTGGYAGVQLVAVLRHLGNFDFFLKLVYVIVLGFIGTAMLVEGVRTLRGTAPSGEPQPGKLSKLFKKLPLQMDFPRSGLRTSALLPVGAGFLVGVLAAFLGVGGGFIMLPAMIYVIGIPTRVAVGTDLFQIVLTSSNVALQQAITNHTVDILLAVTLFAGSTIGAQFGVMASRHLRGEQIRVFLAVIVMAVMMVLLFQLLATPGLLIDFARSGGGH
jgi:hypothetical protein